jgi:hypothetical protein
MAVDLERMREAVGARLRQLGISPDDPRVVSMLSVVREAVQQPPANDRAQIADGAPAGLAGLMGLPERLKLLIDGFVARVDVHTYKAPALSAVPQGERLLELGAADRALVGVYAYVAWALPGRSRWALSKIASDLLRTKLDLTEAQAIQLIRSASINGFVEISMTPNLAVARALARHVEAHGLSATLRPELVALRTRAIAKRGVESAEGRKLLKAVDAMLAYEPARPDAELWFIPTHGEVNYLGTSEGPRFKPAPDAWGSWISELLASLSPETRAGLTRLLLLASENGDKAKPSKGWLKRAALELDRAGRETAGALMLEAIERHDPAVGGTTANQDTLRGLLWLAAMAAPASAPRRLEAYALNCLTFAPQHFAYHSLVLGNATIYAFSLMPGLLGVASLSRLKRRFKRPGEIKTVDRALSALAAARGVTTGELEEIGLPDHGFDADGRITVAVGPTTAVLQIIDGVDLSLSWRSGDGKSLSGPPVATKEAYPDALKSLKAQAKEIAETLKAQRLRIERLYLAQRSWPFEVWRGRYLEEPLVKGLTQRLIWSFEIDGRRVAGLPRADGVFDVAGERLALEGGAVTVELWHPMQSQPAEVQAWRRRLRALDVTQPFKQAHREIYVLTDAELATRDYSNRFAGHIVTQHLFRALTQARGWKCPAFGSWDSGSALPLKDVPERKFRVEFAVDPIESSLNEFKFDHLSTDRIVFVGHDKKPIPLAEIDPVSFSELMRDADLFVGVASIVNDPTWADREETRFRGYWLREAASALGETGKTRRAALADILPGLSIDSRCQLEERHLVVHGKLGKYRIHLGSANIQMEPSSQYLCIVEDRKPSGGHVRLPFEGDATLSIILSKAFLLADDDKIKDKSILSQIARGAALP